MKKIFSIQYFWSKGLRKKLQNPCLNESIVLAGSKNKVMKLIKERLIENKIILSADEICFKEVEKWGNVLNFPDNVAEIKIAEIKLNGKSRLLITD